MAWRYDEEKIERQRAERERRHIEEMDNAPAEDGVCYFFGGDASIVKIGHTRNLWQRINRLKCDCGPYSMDLLATAPGGAARERYYHRIFAEYAIGNEWFERSSPIESEIERLGGGV